MGLNLQKQYMSVNFHHPVLHHNFQQYFSSTNILIQGLKQKSNSRLHIILNKGAMSPTWFYLITVKPAGN